MHKTALSRRAFLNRAAVGASTLVFPSLIPASALGADGAIAPGNRINLGFIGTGRQVFYANLPWHLSSEETQVVAVCDVDSWRMEKARALVEDAYAAKKPSGTWKGCAAYGDFRELLARKEIDAVMISTPDHWHAYMSIAAAQAGKDIALEKPISLTVNCVKRRMETMIPAEIGHRTATMCQIGHIAIETGAKLKWNPGTERFTNHAAANQLLTRASRKPWDLPVV
jgi:myo-inositol 2-dehydrogenase / D-chiro-inositol 1-dehydrogenase